VLPQQRQPDGIGADKQVIHVDPDGHVPAEQDARQPGIVLDLRKEAAWSG
jgi:hypothetical protein